MTGPSGFAPGGRWAELMPLPQPLPAYPAGPPPMLPNPDGDSGDGGGGNGNTSDYDKYHKAMETASGSGTSFARRDPGKPHGQPGDREVLDSIDDDPANPDYEQFGLKEKLQMLENQVRVAEESGDLVGAAIYQAQIDATKAWVDANGTPADVAGEGIEDAIAIGVALLPDPVGDAAGAAVAAKLTGKAMGYAGKALGLSDEVFDGLKEAKQTPKVASKIDDVVKGAAVTAGDTAAEAAAKAGVIIPEGYVPRRVKTDKGWVWRHADEWDNPNFHGDSNSVRVMETTSDYPNGYVRYTNKTGQPVKQQLKDGRIQTGSKGETHYPVGGDTSAPPTWP